MNAKLVNQNAEKTQMSDKQLTKTSRKLFVDCVGVDVKPSPAWRKPSSGNFWLL